MQKFDDSSKMILAENENDNNPWKAKTIGIKCISYKPIRYLTLTRCVLDIYTTNGIEDEIRIVQIYSKRYTTTHTIPSIGTCANDFEISDTISIDIEGPSTFIDLVLEVQIIALGPTNERKHQQRVKRRKSHTKETQRDFFYRIRNELNILKYQSLVRNCFLQSKKSSNDYVNTSRNRLENYSNESLFTSQNSLYINSLNSTNNSNMNLTRHRIKSEEILTNKDIIDNIDNNNRIFESSSFNTQISGYYCDSQSKQINENDNQSNTKKSTSNVLRVDLAKDQEVPKIVIEEIKPDYEIEYENSVIDIETDVNKGFKSTVNIVNENDNNLNQGMGELKCDVDFNSTFTESEVFESDVSYELCNMADDNNMDVVEENMDFLENQRDAERLLSSAKKDLEIDTQNQPITNECAFTELEPKEPSNTLESQLKINFTDEDNERLHRPGGEEVKAENVDKRSGDIVLQTNDSDENFSLDNQSSELCQDNFDDETDQDSAMNRSFSCDSIVTVLNVKPVRALGETIENSYDSKSHCDGKEIEALSEMLIQTKNSRDIDEEIEQKTYIHNESEEGESLELLETANDKSSLTRNDDIIVQNSESKLLSNFFNVQVLKEAVKTSSEEVVNNITHKSVMIDEIISEKALVPIQVETKSLEADNQIAKIQELEPKNEESPIDSNCNSTNVAECQLDINSNQTINIKIPDESIQIIKDDFNHSAEDAFAKNDPTKNSCSEHRLLLDENNDRAIETKLDNKVYCEDELYETTLNMNLLAEKIVDETIGVTISESPDASNNRLEQNIKHNSNEKNDDDSFGKMIEHKPTDLIKENLNLKEESNLMPNTQDSLMSDQNSHSNMVLVYPLQDNLIDSIVPTEDADQSMQINKIETFQIDYLNEDVNTLHNNSVNISPTVTNEKESVHSIANEFNEIQDLLFVVENKSITDSDLVRENSDETLEMAYKIETNDSIDTVEVSSCLKEEERTVNLKKEEKFFSELRTQSLNNVNDINDVNIEMLSSCSLSKINANETCEPKDIDSLTEVSEKEYEKNIVSVSECNHQVNQNQTSESSEIEPQKSLNSFNENFQNLENSNVSEKASENNDERNDSIMVAQFSNKNNFGVSNIKINLKPDTTFNKLQEFFNQTKEEKPNNKTKYSEQHQSTTSQLSSPHVSKKSISDKEICHEISDLLDFIIHKIIDNQESLTESRDKNTFVDYYEPVMFEGKANKLDQNFELEFEKVKKVEDMNSVIEIKENPKDTPKFLNDSDNCMMEQKGTCCVLECISNDLKQQIIESTFDIHNTLSNDAEEFSHEITLNESSVPLDSLAEMKNVQIVNNELFIKETNVETDNDEESIIGDQKQDNDMLDSKLEQNSHIEEVKTAINGFEEKNNLKFLVYKENHSYLDDIVSETSNIINLNNLNVESTSNLNVLTKISEIQECVSLESHHTPTKPLNTSNEKNHVDVIIESPTAEKNYESKLLKNADICNGELLIEEYKKGDCLDTDSFGIEGIEHTHVENSNNVTESQIEIEKLNDSNDSKPELNNQSAYVVENTFSTPLEDLDMTSDSQNDNVEPKSDCEFPDFEKQSKIKDQELFVPVAKINESEENNRLKFLTENKKIYSQPLSDIQNQKTLSDENSQLEELFKFPIHQVTSSTKCTITTEASDTYTKLKFEEDNSMNTVGSIIIDDEEQKNLEKSSSKSYLSGDITNQKCRDILHDVLDQLSDVSNKIKFFDEYSSKSMIDEPFYSSLEHSLPDSKKSSYYNYDMSGIHKENDKLELKVSDENNCIKNDQLNDFDTIEEIQQLNSGKNDMLLEKVCFDQIDENDCIEKLTMNITDNDTVIALSNQSKNINKVILSTEQTEDFEVSAKSDIQDNIAQTDKSSTEPIYSLEKMSESKVNSERVEEVIFNLVEESPKTILISKSIEKSYLEGTSADIEETDPYKRITISDLVDVLVFESYKSPVDQSRIASELETSSYFNEVYFDSEPHHKYVQNKTSNENYVVDSESNDKKVEKSTHSIQEEIIVRDECSLVSYQLIIDQDEDNEKIYSIEEKKVTARSNISNCISLVDESQDQTPLDDQIVIKCENQNILEDIKINQIDLGALNISKDKKFSIESNQELESISELSSEIPATPRTDYDESPRYDIKFLSPRSEVSSVVLSSEETSSDFESYAAKFSREKPKKPNRDNYFELVREIELINSKEQNDDNRKILSESQILLANRDMENLNNKKYAYQVDSIEVQSSSVETLTLEKQLDLENSDEEVLFDEKQNDFDCESGSSDEGYFHQSDTTCSDQSCFSRNSLHEEEMQSSSSLYLGTENVESIDKAQYKLKTPLLENISQKIGDKGHKFYTSFLAEKEDESLINKSFPILPKLTQQEERNFDQFNTLSSKVVKKKRSIKDKDLKSMSKLPTIDSSNELQTLEEKNDEQRLHQIPFIFDRYSKKLKILNETAFYQDLVKYDEDTASFNIYELNPEYIQICDIETIIPKIVDTEDCSYFDVYSSWNNNYSDGYAKSIKEIRSEALFDPYSEECQIMDIKYQELQSDVIVSLVKLLQCNKNSEAPEQDLVINIDTSLYCDLFKKNIENHDFFPFKYPPITSVKAEYPNNKQYGAIYCEHFDKFSEWDNLHSTDYLSSVKNNVNEEDFDPYSNHVESTYNKVDNNNVFTDFEIEVPKLNKDAVGVFPKINLSMFKNIKDNIEKFNEQQLEIDNINQIQYTDLIKTDINNHDFFYFKYNPCIPSKTQEISVRRYAPENCAQFDVYKEWDNLNSTNYLSSVKFSQNESVFNPYSSQIESEVQDYQAKTYFELEPKKLETRSMKAFSLPDWLKLNEFKVQDGLIIDPDLCLYSDLIKDSDDIYDFNKFKLFKLEKNGSHEFDLTQSKVPNDNCYFGDNSKSDLSVSADYFSYLKTSNDNCEFDPYNYQYEYNGYDSSNIPQFEFDLPKSSRDAERFFPKINFATLQNSQNTDTQIVDPLNCLYTELYKNSTDVIEFDNFKVFKREKEDLNEKKLAHIKNEIDVCQFDQYSLWDNKYSLGYEKNDIFEESAVSIDTQANESKDLFEYSINTGTHSVSEHNKIIKSIQSHIDIQIEPKITSTIITKHTCKINNGDLIYSELVKAIDDVCDFSALILNEDFIDFSVIETEVPVFDDDNTQFDKYSPWDNSITSNYFNHLRKPQDQCDFDPYEVAECQNNSYGKIDDSFELTLQTKRDKRKRHCTVYQRLATLFEVDEREDKNDPESVYETGVFDRYRNVVEISNEKASYSDLVKPNKNIAEFGLYKLNQKNLDIKENNFNIREPIAEPTDNVCIFDKYTSREINNISYYLEDSLDLDDNAIFDPKNANFNKEQVREVKFEPEETVRVEKKQSFFGKLFDILKNRQLTPQDSAHKENRLENNKSYSMDDCGQFDKYSEWNNLYSNNYNSSKKEPTNETVFDAYQINLDNYEVYEKPIDPFELNLKVSNHNKEQKSILSRLNWFKLDKSQDLDISSEPHVDKSQNVKMPLNNKMELYSDYVKLSDDVSDFSIYSYKSEYEKTIKNEPKISEIVGLDNCCQFDKYSEWDTNYTSNYLKNIKSPKTEGIFDAYEEIERFKQDDVENCNEPELLKEKSIEASLDTLNSIINAELYDENKSGIKIEITNFDSKEEALNSELSQSENVLTISSITNNKSEWDSAYSSNYIDSMKTSMNESCIEEALTQESEYVITSNLNSELKEIIVEKEIDDKVEKKNREVFEIGLFDKNKYAILIEDDQIRYSDLVKINKDCEDFSLYKLNRETIQVGNKFFNQRNKLQTSDCCIFDLYSNWDFNLTSDYLKTLKKSTYVEDFDPYLVQDTLTNEKDQLNELVEVTGNQNKEVCEPNELQNRQIEFIDIKETGLINQMYNRFEINSQDALYYDLVKKNDNETEFPLYILNDKLVKLFSITKSPSRLFDTSDNPCIFNRYIDDLTRLSSFKATSFYSSAKLPVIKPLNDDFAQFYDTDYVYMSEYDVLKRRGGLMEKIAELDKYQIQTTSLGQLISSIFLITFGASLVFIFSLFY